MAAKVKIKAAQITIGKTARVNGNKATFQKGGLSSSPLGIQLHA